MRFSLTGAAALLALATSSLASSAVISSGKLSVVDSATSIARKSIQFSSGSVSPLALTELSADDLLRLTFEFKDDSTSDPIVPQQVSLLWERVLSPGEAVVRNEWLVPVKVRKSGKAKFELDLARAPTHFLTLGSSHPVKMDLLISGPDLTAQRVTLATFQIADKIALPFPYPPDEDLPKSWEVEKHSIQPELHWTFREPEKKVNPVLALVGLAVVLAPWVVLATIAKAVSLEFPVPQGWRAVFFLGVVATEALIVVYWIGLKLIPTLPLFGALVVFTAWSGRRALGEVRQRRLRAEGKQKKAE